MDELEQASAGLMWMSESDYPFDVFRLEDAVDLTPDLLRHLADQPIDAPVAVGHIDDFFHAAVTDYPGQDEVNRQAVEKYRWLVQVLKINLQDIRVYRVGRVNIRVYVMGKAPSDRWIGIQTRVVET